MRNQDIKIKYKSRTGILNFNIIITRFTCVQKDTTNNNSYVLT